MIYKTLLSIGLLTLLMAACAPAEPPVVQPSDTLMPTDTDTPEPTEADTPEPTETDTPEPTETDTPEPTETDTSEPTDTPAPPTNTPAPVNTAAPANTVAPTAASAATAVPPTAAPTDLVSAAEILEISQIAKQIIEGMGGQIDIAVNSGFIDCGAYATGYAIIAAVPVIDVNTIEPAAQGAYIAYREAIDTVLDTSHAIYTQCTTPGDSPISAFTWTVARLGVSTAIDLLNQAIGQLGG